MPILGNMRHNLISPYSNWMSWGYNNIGQLGIGSVASKSSPIQIGSLSTWMCITGDASASIGITSDGTMWGVGGNGYYTLGIAGTQNRSTLVKIGNSLDTWKSVSVGGNSTTALKVDGTMWAWGYNNRGQLGFSSGTSNVSTPVQVGSANDWKVVNRSVFGAEVCAIKNDGTLWTWGWNGTHQLGLGHDFDVTPPTQVGTATNWLQASIGYNVSAGIRTDGTLWVWGWNYYGHAGNGTAFNGDISTPIQLGSATDWASAVCGNGCAFAIKNNGSLWAWGKNNFGQLGLGDTTPRSSPVQVGSYTNWEQVHSYETTRAIRTDGTLWACGYNNNGQIGNNSRTNQSIFVQIGLLNNWRYVTGSNATTLALRNEYQEPISNLRGMGYNTQGQLGNNTSTHRSSPVLVGSHTDWTQITCGYTVTAVKPDGTLWAWGRNGYGQLGLGDITHRSIPTQVGALSDWKQTTGISSNILAIKTDGTLWTWGYNSNLLFDPNPIVGKYSSPIQVGSLNDWSVIESGDGTTVAAIKTDGTLWTWGYHNWWGVLGLGDTVDRSSPVQVGSLTDWKQVAVSQSHMIAIKTDGTLWSWGVNVNGELGLGNTTNKSSPVQVGSLTDWKKVATGTNTSPILALKTDGTLWSWGENGRGELGLGDIISRSSPTQVGSDTDWKDIPKNLGQHVTAAIKNNGTLWVCGYNGLGQLGLGDNIDRSFFTQVGTLKNWLSISAGVKTVMGIIQL